MKKVLMAFVCLAYLCPLGVAQADLEANEKTFFTELKKVIPQDRFVSVDDLHKKWLEVQEGKSKAIIIDIRTKEEFDNGHIKGSSNVDSGHAYTVPKKITDPNQEIWVFCRTQHRATYFVSMLHNYGYKNAYLVEGGVVGWIEKGYPLVNEYLGEIKVTNYSKQLKEEYVYREGH
ncbi:MAG: rhodanese-like domain-containing protein [Desulfobulbaceae bacterium]|nr:rhodanese-like domain-containing protein [Desulfobulbaceae bacterium]